VAQPHTLLRVVVRLQEDHSFPYILVEKLLCVRNPAGHWGQSHRQDGMTRPGWVGGGRNQTEIQPTTEKRSERAGDKKVPQELGWLKRKREVWVRSCRLPWKTEEGETRAWQQRNSRA
jgi:hypothetical protein